MSKFFPESELIINPDGSIFHLHLKPEFLADKVILVGDPGRVKQVAGFFDGIECDVENREFLRDLLEAMDDELPAPKEKKKRRTDFQ